MSDLINTLSEMGADNAYNMTEEHNKLVRQMEAVKKVIRIRQPETAYSVGDKVIVQGLQNADIQLRCETAGTTAAGEINGGYDNLEVGQIINDGTVSWAVVNSVTMPDLPDSPVASVNGKTGNVNLTANDVGAEKKDAVKEHNTAEDAHGKLFDAHRAEKASESESGHVKIDGKSIQIDADGVIKAVGGLAIGSIFSYASAEPPEGAYLLNGQTIYNCSTLYPDFWDWLTTKVSAGYVRSVTALEYEQDIAEYGFCGAFVISNNDVRLPTWKGYQTPLGNSVPVVGNGMALGLTDGTNNVGMTLSRINSVSSLNYNVNVYGSSVGVSSNSSSINPDRVAGVTEDPEKSGLIADTSGYAKDGFYWCIQVFNAATELSQQESAQLASQMQMKAQTDLANVNTNLDFVVESWNDNVGNWYRKYRSGWIEQGGIQDGANPMTVTLLLKFADVNYRIRVTTRDVILRGNTQSIFDITETSFSVHVGGGTNEGVSSAFKGKLEWEAKGYMA